MKMLYCRGGGGPLRAGSFFFFLPYGHGGNAHNMKVTQGVRCVKRASPCLGSTHKILTSFSLCHQQDQILSHSGVTEEVKCAPACPAAPLIYGLYVLEHLCFQRLGKEAFRLHGCGRLYPFCGPFENPNRCLPLNRTVNRMALHALAVR